VLDYSTVVACTLAGTLRRTEVGRDLCQQLGQRTVLMLKFVYYLGGKQGHSYIGVRRYEDTSL
jgi:hypothetical protein